MRKLEKVAIAGASGFIGKMLIDEIKDEYNVRALARHTSENSENVEWQECDLYSLLDAENGLKDVDYAFYLVHSMNPNARLTQSNFADMDLILADNFGRAAKKAGVKQIIYLGGIIPESKDSLSPHLQSRLEVEKALGAYGVPVTTIRASLIVGPHGSSFQIVENLVKKLPVMVCPKWTLSNCQPISVYDVLKILHWCIGNPETYNKTSDAGGADIMPYIDLMRETARLMNLKRRIFSVPVFSAGFSKLWVSVFSGTPIELVSPLIESLRHPMVAKNAWIQERMGLKVMSFSEAVSKVLEFEKSEAKPQIKSVQKNINKERINDVRSIQRLPLPLGKDAEWIAVEYARWLPKFMHPFIKVKVDENKNCFFYINFINIPLLELSYSKERSSPDRTLFYITGGFLTNNTSKRGRLEFREIIDKKYILAAIHDYYPTLPWFIYNMTQARVHLWVMQNFSKHLYEMSKSRKLLMA